MPGADAGTAPKVNGSLTVPAQPLISVVMPVYDAEAHLAEAVASLQAQSYRRWELIIVDDGSRDGSVVLARRLAARDHRIRPISVSRCGVGAALNAGIAQARGELVARMDADDVAGPERFQVQLDWMRKTGVEVCGSWAVWFGDASGIWWVPERHDSIALSLALDPSMVHPTVLMHAEIARSNPYSELNACEDFELWTRLIDRHRLGNVPAVLLRYRRHTSQVSSVQRVRIRAGAEACRRVRFDAIFPGADHALLSAFDRVRRAEPCSDLTQLEHAGALLTRLSQSPEALLRTEMLRRWRNVCRRSAHLGIDVYKTYARVASEIGVANPDADREIRLVCGLGPRRNSRLERRRRRLTGDGSAA